MRIYIFILCVVLLLGARGSLAKDDHEDFYEELTEEEWAILQNWDLLENMDFLKEDWDVIEQLEVYDE